MIDIKYATHKRDPFFELAAPYIKPDSKVLDIGAGKADFSDFFSRNDFYLLDGNQETVDRLKTRHSHSFWGMLPKLMFEDCMFDVIHCSHVVEHLQPQDFYDTLKEMDRCLAPGGVIIISTPLMWEGFYNDLSHIRPYGPSVFQRYFLQSPSKTLTRSSISQEYQIKKLQYRFKENKVSAELYNFNNNFIVKCVLYFIRKLEGWGLKRFIKTGYTIILQKQHKQPENIS